MGEDLMKLDLPGTRCTEFSFSSQFAVTEHVNVQIGALMKATELVRIEDPVLEIAPYGSIYNVGDTTIGIVGRLWRNTESNQSPCWLHIRYLAGDNDFPPPPDDWKPVSYLLKIVADLLDEVAIDCEATFTYELGERVRSRVALPMPLLLADRSSPPSLTHIESVVLSRREEDQFTHTVGIEPLDGGSSIMHTVNFSVSSALTWDSIRQMFETAGSLSLSLIDQHLEEPR